MPTAAKIFLIMDSGARSLMLPTKTVITGPAVSALLFAPAACFVALAGCAVPDNVNGCCAFVVDSNGVGRAYSCGPDR